MELLINVSDTLRFTVEVTDDYNVKGTFHPEASCDLEYYGYRETQFNITSMEDRPDKYSMWLPVDEEVLRVWVKSFEDVATLMVQDKIDEENKQ